MTSFEVFTAEELISLFVEICSEVECIVEDEDEYTTGGTSLVCDVGGLEFTCFLLGEEPFWNGLSLFSSRPAPPNPLHFCNRFNSGPHLSRVYQIQPLDDDDDFDVDADGRMKVMARQFIHFDGGVTLPHIAFLIYMWIEDLCTFNELEDDVDDDDAGSDIDFEIPDNLAGAAVSLIERITAFLEIRGSSNARGIAKALRVEKQKVNGVLYGNLNTFGKSADQPAIWSLKK